MYAFALTGGLFFCFAIYHTCIRQSDTPKVKHDTSYYKRRHQRRFSDTMEELDEWAKMKYDLDRIPVMKKMGYNPEEFQDSDSEDSSSESSESESNHDSDEECDSSAPEQEHSVELQDLPGLHCETCDVTTHDEDKCLCEQNVPEKVLDNEILELD